MSEEQHDNHCWLVFNEVDWHIDRIERLGDGRELFHMWRLDVKPTPGRTGTVDTQIAQATFDFKNVDWSSYNKLAILMMEEQYKCRLRPETMRRIASTTSTSRRLLN
jgi:hypothetical protein